MNYEDLIAELKKLGKSDDNKIVLTDLNNLKSKFYILPNDILLSCYIHILSDINLKEVSCKNLAEIQKSIMGMDIEFNNSFLKSFLSNISN